MFSSFLKPTEDKANGGIERRVKTRDGLDARLRKRSVHVGGCVIDRNGHSLVAAGHRFAVAQLFFALEIPLVECARGLASVPFAE